MSKASAFVERKLESEGVMNIIGDIAGEFDALIELVKRMPDEDILLVGDLVDRGPKSLQVIEWAIDTPNVSALLGQP